MVTPSLVTLAERVRFLRTCVPDLSQRGADRLAGLHQSHLWQIEEGHRQNPTYETASKIAHLFGVALDWLLEGKGEAPSQESVQEAVARSRAAASTTEAA